MRYCLFACLALFNVSFAVQAFEVESEISFPVRDGDTDIRILSTADIDLFAPIIESFQDANPSVGITYISVSSTEVLQAVVVEDLAFDLVVSSAMDLQTKLANDGYAMRINGTATSAVPDWAQWRDSVFAFTQEPAAIVLSKQAFDGLDLPTTRQDLIATLRANPDRFLGRLGTYDIRSSGLGYLFATQDSRTSEAYWRLTEVFGSLQTQLYCCSSDMIEDVSSGEIAVAYNVLGSYARARVDLAGTIAVIEPEDFTTVMLRTALVPKNAPNPEAALDFLAHLMTLAWANQDGDAFTFPNRGADLSDLSKLRPIRMGPGLLVYLDQFKREQFIAAWENAVLQH